MKMSSIESIREYLFGMKYWMKKKIEGNFTPILESDSQIHNVILPIATELPRILSSGARTTINTVSTDDYYNIDGKKTCKLINAASYHYGGYGNIEYDADEVIKYVLNNIDYMNNNEQLDRIAGRELCSYLGGYENYIFTSTGYGMNMTVFPAMKKLWNDPLFIMDSECHNSMFMGLRSCSGRVVKFHHNNIDELKILLEKYTKDEHDIVVCCESLYSMTGSLCKLQEIVALKNKYRFRIYVDEAHSLFALGTTGRGILEHYNINPSLVDVLGFTLSKSMGAIGGVIVSHEKLEHEYNNIIPNVVKVRLLQVLRKTNLMRLRMTNLRSISEYIYDRLSDAGLIMKSERSMPIVSFHVGGYRTLSKVVSICQESGLAITGAGPPATPKGEAVVRLCVCAVHTLENARFIADTVIMSAILSDVKRNKSEINKHHLILMDDTKEIANESFLVDESIMSIISTMNHIETTNRHKDIVNNTIDIYGLGACSARWLYGTFDIHLRAEQLLAKKYGMEDALIYSDSKSSILFTIEALIEPLKNKKINHLVYLPAGVVDEAINMAKPDKKRYLLNHDDVRPNGKYYTTIYSNNISLYKHVINDKNCVGLTYITHDNTNITISHKNMRVVVVGTNEKYGLQGGYACSNKNTINILKWRSRGYFFTASPMPVNTALLMDRLVEC